MTANIKILDGTSLILKYYRTKNIEHIPMKKRNGFLHTIKILSAIVGSLCVVLEFTNAIMQLVIQVHQL